MPFEHQDGHGSLHKNDKGDNPKRPDYRGSCSIDGKVYEIAGWIKDGNKGKFLSLAISPEKERPVTHEKTEDQSHTEDIPF